MIEADGRAVPPTADAVILEHRFMLGTITPQGFNEGRGLCGKYGRKVSPVPVRHIGPCEKVAKVSAAPLPTL